MACKIREFNDVGRTAAQQLPPSIIAAQQAQAAAAAAATAAAASNAKIIKLEDLKDYKDKQQALAGKKRRHESTAGTKRTTAKNSVAETEPSSGRPSADTIESDEADESERKRLRREVQILQETNSTLLNQALAREQEIRMEVSEEMMTRSSHLLDQIQTLRKQLAEREEKEIHMQDVTRSVKKAKRTQKQKAEEDLIQSLHEVEEELERTKAEHEVEVFKLRSENFKLKEELARYKPTSVVNKPPTPRIRALSNPPPQQDENGTVQINNKPVGGCDKSPKRSPLSPLGKNISNSPAAGNNRSISPLKPQIHVDPALNKVNPSYALPTASSSAVPMGSPGPDSYFNKLRSHFARA